jgi:ribosomal protein S18 acetylase RimI-like enzyme
MSGAAGIKPPEKLAAGHDLAAFDSGEPALDEWLRRRALQNEASGASRTYVVCAGQRVAGYYTLAAGSVTHAEVAGRIRRNMPAPVPVMVIGRLAVDREFQGRGIGSGLLRDAVLRTVQAAEIAGIRALLIHAKTGAAKKFYERHGFVSSPVDPLTVMITVAEAMAMLAGRSPMG